MRIGVFGGTFDPPHLGHLVAAQELHVRLALDRLLLVPAAAPPHKPDREVTAAGVRLEMLRAAVAGDDRFEVSELEIRRAGASYTVDTLRALRDEHPDAELLLAIGSDQLAEFGSWREPEAIVRLATLVTFDRPGAPAADGSGWPARAVSVPEIAVSSTDIRRRVANDEPITYLVPAAVEAIIRRESLYRRDPDASPDAGD